MKTHTKKELIDTVVSAANSIGIKIERNCPYCKTPITGKSGEFISCPKCKRSIQLF